MSRAAAVIAAALCFYPCIGYAAYLLGQRKRHCALGSLLPSAIAAALAVLLLVLPLKP